MVNVRLTLSLSPSTGSLGMTRVQSIPILKTLIPVSLASFSSVSGSVQNLNLSSLKVIQIIHTSIPLKINLQVTFMFFLMFANGNREMIDRVDITQEYVNRSY